MLNKPYIKEHTILFHASYQDAGDVGSIPGLGRSPGGGVAIHASILAWRISMDRGAWWATVHGVTKSWTQLSNYAQHSTLIRDA